MTFVQNGGGLFVIPNHSGADRNNDGYDGVEVVHDLMTNNSVDSTNPFGFSIDSLSISSEDPRAISDSSAPVLNGSFGTVTGSIIRSGAAATLRPSANSSVKGLVYRTGYSGNTLYDGRNDTAGTNAALALNATAWLSGATEDDGGDDGGGDGTCTAAELLANPGFEPGSSSWTATSGVITTDSAQAARTGSYGYTLRSFDLSAYAGQTVTVKFTGVEGSVLQTSFVVDDTALNVS